MFKQLSEFFKDENGRLSMARLLAFMSFWPASSVLGVLHTETALMAYLATYAAQYGTSKWIDKKYSMKAKK